MPSLPTNHVTMEDVAQACGVNKKTVSRAFAGSPGVKAETKAKILEAAQRLNYEFNTLAQNFTSKRSRLIGLATTFNGLVGSTYFREMLKGFASILNKAEMDIVLFDTDTDSFNDGEKLAKLYRQRRVDGLLVVAPHTYEQFLNTLTQVHVPMVVVGVRPSCEGVCSVYSDDAAGIRRLCLHLYSLGHRRIAFVTGTPCVTTSDLRRQGYVDFCREKKLKLPPEYLQPGYYDMKSGYKAARNLFTMDPRPTAVLAANDLSAFGVIERAKEIGLRVPEDISVTGFDDLPTSVDGTPFDGTPSLTTVHQPVAEMGKQSAIILLNALKKGVVPMGQTIMDAIPIIRESTAPLKEGRLPVAKKKRAR